MAAITCPTDCTSTLPVVSFSTCAPEINASEITEIYISKSDSAALATWTTATEWTERMGTPLDADDKIIKLIVSAEKPAPGKQEREISNFRKYIVRKDHVINFEIDESNSVNHDFVRQMECGGQFRLWYKTNSGHMFGGNEGVLANINADMVLDKGENGIIRYVGTAEWKSKHTEERCVSPI